MILAARAIELMTTVCAVGAIGALGGDGGTVGLLWALGALSESNNDWLFTAGIGAGFVAYVLLKVVRGKARSVHVLMWIVAVLFLVYFGIDPVTDWLT